MMMAEGKSGQKRAAKQNIVELHFLITDSENCALYIQYSVFPKIMKFQNILIQLRFVLKWE